MLQLLSIFAGDNRYEEAFNQLPKGGDITMCEVLDKIEARGELNAFYKLIKQGLLTIDQAAKAIGMTIEELQANFKQYNLAL